MWVDEYIGGAIGLQWITKTVQDLICVIAVFISSLDRAMLEGDLFGDQCHGGVLLPAFIKDTITKITSENTQQRIEDRLNLELDKRILSEPSMKEFIC